MTVACVASRPIRRLRVARTAAAASGAITPTTGTASDAWSAGSAADVAALQATTISFTPCALEVAGDLVREARDLARAAAARTAAARGRRGRRSPRSASSPGTRGGRSARRRPSRRRRWAACPWRADSRPMLSAWRRRCAIGTCSWADDALVKHWYPKGVPREGAARATTRSASRRSRSTRPSTACPTSEMVQGWADRTPPGFVMHVKAFGLMTRHPVRLEQLPPDLRDGMPVDERGRVDRPPRELRARRLPRVPRRARAAAPGRQARRDPLPAAAVRRPEAGVVRLPRVGPRPARRRRDARRVPPPRLVRGGAPRRGARAGSRSGGCRT